MLLRLSLHIAHNALLSVGLLFLVAGSAQATLLNVDQIIYQIAPGTAVDDTLLSGTIDVTNAGSVLTIILTNTSADDAFIGTPSRATMLLTGFGIQLGGGVSILSGTVTLAGGSTAVNFEFGQDTTDISNQWLYANNSIDGYSNILGALTVDTVASSVANGQPGSTPFTLGTDLNGPGYGAISALESEFAGGSTPGVNDSIILALTLSGPAPDAGTIDAGNVVLAFGSPNVIPEPGTALLMGMGLMGLASFRRRS